MEQRRVDWLTECKPEDEEGITAWADKAFAHATVILYHGGCLDGMFAAATVAKFATRGNVLAVPMQYDTPLHSWLLEACLRTTVYVVDFSLPTLQMDALCLCASWVVWIDHHSSAIQALEGWMVNMPSNATAYLSRDNTESGAMLAHLYTLVDAPVPAVIRHVDDRDRWQFKLPGTKEVCAALYALVDNVEDALEYLSDARAHDDLEAQGAVLLIQQSKQLKQLEATAKQFFTYVICNAPSFFASELGNRLAVKYQLPAIIWQHTQDGIRLSIRSVAGAKGLTAKQIALQGGGGGHEHAAGATLKPNTDAYKEFLDALI